jgi:phage gpG-like protein
MDEYAQSKARDAWMKKASRKPLVASGGLSQSIRYQVTDGGASVEVGTNIPYAATHQFGATIRPKSKKALAIPQPDGSVRLVKKVTIPARPFLGFSEGDKATVLGILSELLADATHP